MTVKATPTETPTYSETLQAAIDAAETLEDLLLDIIIPNSPDLGTLTSLRREARYKAMGIIHNLENLQKEEV